MQLWTRLSDAEIAEVRNYILTSFVRDLLPRAFAPISGTEAKGLRSGHLSFKQVRGGSRGSDEALVAQIRISHRSQTSKNFR
jgi:hypothetical protein